MTKRYHNEKKPNLFLLFLFLFIKQNKLQQVREKCCTLRSMYVFDWNKHRRDLSKNDPTLYRVENEENNNNNNRKICSNNNIFHKWNTNDALVIICKMTTTRHSKQTTTYSRFISINTRIIHTIASSDDQYFFNNDYDGGALSKSKCKSLFSGHFARILIVILVSFTFADMVNGE